MPTVPEVIIERARAEGLRHFFGLPSSDVILHLLDAGRKQGVEFVASAHESSGVISAGYYGYFNGGAGISLAIQGVGAGNMVGGSFNVLYERKPAICICECPAIDDFGNWGQHGDHPGLFQTATKKCLRVTEENATSRVLPGSGKSGSAVESRGRESRPAWGCVDGVTLSPSRVPTIAHCRLSLALEREFTGGSTV